MFGSRFGNMPASYKEYLLLGMFYLIAHGGILLIPNAIYWDDWTLYRVESGVILDTFRQAGSMFNLTGYLHVGMLGLGAWSYKVFTFLLMFGSGLLLDQILKRIKSIDAETRFFIVLLFLILPFNLARVTLIVFPAVVCYFLFFAAWLLMDRYRVVALVLFFLSFNVNSLLVFYAVPMFDLLYRGGHLLNVKSALMFGIRRIDFMLVPFIYFFIKQKFYVPTGPYEGYYKCCNFNDLIISPKAQFNDFLSLKVSIGVSLVFAILAFLFVKDRLLITTRSSYLSLKLLFFGLLLFVLGAFPYWLLGFVPTFQTFSSRHQLLLPLGTSFAMVGFLSLGNQRLSIGVISAVIGASLALNVTSYVAFFRDWQKQQQIIQFYSKSDAIKQAGLIIVEDNDTSARSYSFYEMNGQLEMAFGNERHFAVPMAQVDRYMSGKFEDFFTANWKAGQFRKDPALPPLFVRIDGVKPSSFTDEVVTLLYPKLNITVTQFDLVNYRNQLRTP